ncbi:MAG: PEGA domain-containing protein [Candidatus Dojkabacteria bacterium]
MKKWKSALIAISIVLVLSLLLFFLPPENIFKQIPIIKTFYQNTTLEITMPNGKAMVKINGKEYGETPTNIQSLVAGEYEVELERISSQDGYYKPQKFKVLLTKNSTSRINMEIGPDDNLHGSILYYSEDRSVSNKGKLTITTNSPSTKVYLNSEFLKSTPITNLDMDEGEYELLLEAEGYESLSLPVVIRKGYILNIKGYLLPISLIFDKQESNE